MNPARLALCALLALAWSGCAHHGSDSTATATSATPTVAAARPSDRQMTGLLVGTWRETDPANQHVSLEITYAADGSMSGWFLDHEKTAAGEPTDLKVSGRAKWEVADGKIRVTSCVTDPAGRLPDEYATEIVSINATDLVLKAPADGTLRRRHRVVAAGSH